MSAGALALFFQLAEVLAVPLIQYDRGAIAQGAWWRLVTGNWIHWNFGHAFWDVFALLVLGGWVEAQSKRLWMWVVFGGSVFIGLAMLLYEPWMEFYRGLSGVDMALAAAWWCILYEMTRGKLYWRWGVVAGGLLLVGKMVLELYLGHALFAADLGVGIKVAVSAHATGLLYGLACGWVYCRWVLGGGERRQVAGARSEYGLSHR